MSEHVHFESRQTNPDVISLTAGTEAWRLEVDQIIAAIHPRSTSAPPPPVDDGECTATLVLPQCPDDTGSAQGVREIALARTEPGVPCSSALNAPVPALQDQADQATSPAHPAAQASLCAACEQDVDEEDTREHPVEYPLPPSPFAYVAHAEPRQGGWFFDPASAPNNALQREVTHAATEVHRVLGPGLRPHVYAQCLLQELALRGLRALSDVPVSVSYKGRTLEDAFRAALLVEGSLLVDIVGVAQIEAAHEAHLRTFLVQSGMQSALLLNFHEPELARGIRSMER